MVRFSRASLLLPLSFAASGLVATFFLFLNQNELRGQAVPTTGSNEKADLSISIQLDKKEYKPGSTMKAKFIIKNNRPDAASNVSMQTGYAATETIPKGCGVNVGGISGTTCLIDKIPKGKSVTKILNFPVSQDFSSCEYVYQLFAGVKFNGTDPSAKNNVKEAQYRIACAGYADLVLGLKADKVNVTKGEYVRYAVTVKNTSGNNAPNVSVNFHTPKSTTIDSLPVGCTFYEANGTMDINCRKNLLKTGSSVKWEFDAMVLETAPCGSYLQPWAEATSLAQELNYRDNRNKTPVEIMVSCPVQDAPLMVKQTANVDKVLSGERVIYTLSLRNEGAIPLTGIEVKDVYKNASIGVLSDPPKCFKKDSNAICLLNAVQPGNEATISYTVIVPKNAPCGEFLAHSLSVSVGGSPVPAANIAAVPPVKIFCKTTDMQVRLMGWRISTGILGMRAMVSNHGGSESKSQLIIEPGQQLTITKPTQLDACHMSAGNLVCDLPPVPKWVEGSRIEFTVQCVNLNNAGLGIRASVTPQDAIETSPGNNSVGVANLYCN